MQFIKLGGGLGWEERHINVFCAVELPIHADSKRSFQSIVGWTLFQNQFHPTRSSLSSYYFFTLSRLSPFSTHARMGMRALIRIQNDLINTHFLQQPQTNIYTLPAAATDILM